MELWEDLYLSMPFSTKLKEAFKCLKQQQFNVSQVAGQNWNKFLR